MSSESSRIDQAGRRLIVALDALEASLRRRSEDERQAGSLRAEVDALSADRSRLAQELDKARAHAARLETASGHALGRVDAAIKTIREVLAGTGQSPDAGRG